MKELLFTVLLAATLAVNVMAQHDHDNHPAGTATLKADSSAQTKIIGEATEKQFARLLSSYYNIKNALVAGDATSASTNALAFLKTANAIDYKVISEGNIHILSKYAGLISASDNLVKQREGFASLSYNLATVVRSLELNSAMVYLQYCPMKKAYWLSTEKEIKNPYYGSAMLNCGEVKEILD